MSIYTLEIKTIRKALKLLAPSLSVRRGRGTGYDWIEIKGSKEWGEFTDEERESLIKVGLRPGANFAVISPDSRRYWVETLAKKLGVEIPEELRDEYRRRDIEKARMERRLREIKERQESCQHEWVKMPYLVLFQEDKALYRCKKCGKEEIR